MVRRSWPVVALLVVGVAVFFSFRERDPEERALRGVGPEFPELEAKTTQPGSGPVERKRDVEQGKVSGMLRYTDGRPAPGLRILLAGVAQRTTDHEGRFHFGNVRSGGHFAYLEELPLGGFHVAPGEHRTVQFEVARGAPLSGTVADTRTGAPIEDITVTLSRQDGGTPLFARMARKGRFHFTFVPGGRHTLVFQDTDDSRLFAEPPVAYETHSLPVAVGKSDLSVEVRLRRAQSLPVRFENVPEAWRQELPFSLRLRDRSGRLPDLWWGSGETPLWLDTSGRLKHPPPAPPPGDYELSLEANRWRRPIRWLSQGLLVPVGPVPEQTVHLPDGAPVTLVVESDSHRVGPVSRIGPVILFAKAPAVRFPHVPEGRHAIWLLRIDHEIRVGEVEVRAGRTVTKRLTLTGTSSVRGKPDPFGPRPVELLDLAGQVVAREAASGPGFAFAQLQPGSYVLVLSDRRIPIELGEGEGLDLGILR